MAGRYESDEAVGAALRQVQQQDERSFDDDYDDVRDDASDQAYRLPVHAGTSDRAAATTPASQRFGANESTATRAYTPMSGGSAFHAATSSTARASVASAAAATAASARAATPTPATPGDLLDVNRALVQAGFQSIGSAAEAVERLQAVLRAHQRRADLVRDLVMQRKDGEAAVIAATASAADVAKAEQAAAGATSRAAELETEVQALRVQLERAKRDAAQQQHRSKQRVEAMVASARAQESRYHRLQQRLQASVDREAEEKARLDVLFHKLMQRSPRVSSPSDQRLQDVLRVFSERAEASQQQIDYLRKEVRHLNALLAAADNAYIAGQRPDAAKHAPVLSDTATATITELQQQVAQARHQVLATETEQIQPLRAEIARLRASLASRPTTKEFAQLRRQLEQAQGPRWGGSTGSEPRSRIGAAVQLSAVPAEATDAQLAEVCCLLQVAHPDAVIPALSKMMRVLDAVPQLDQFVRDVYRIVSTAKSPGMQPLPSQPQPEDILDAIRCALRSQDDSAELKELQHDLVAVLARRPMQLPAQHGKSALPSSSRQVLEQVAELVQSERQLLATQEAIDAADRQVAAAPDALTNRVLSHIQRLFDIRSVGGIIPYLNHLYLRIQETDNVLAHLRSALHLDTTASLSACVAAVRAAIADAAAARRSASDDDGDDDGMPLDDTEEALIHVHSVH